MPFVSASAAGGLSGAEGTLISGADTVAFRAKQFVEGLPGRKASRGGKIPDDLHARIYAAANGITQTMWGRPPNPEQLQWLFDNGHHTPSAIHDQYGQLSHPHASGLSVADYQRYSAAYSDWKRHR